MVLPTFLPTIPGLVEKLGGGNPLMIAYSINVGSHLVDVSPLSTLGALCLAAAPPQEDRTSAVPQADGLGLVDGPGRRARLPALLRLPLSGVGSARAARC